MLGLGRMQRVVVGISGGVDSAVAAALLKKSGYAVQGVYMENWDEADESGACLLKQQEDISDAKEVCDKLQIPFHTVSFVKEYWNDVFTTVLSDYEAGRTPNPDVLCNRYVKFGSFYRFARDELKTDLIATGHYARIGASGSDSTCLENVRLLRAIDCRKDQTLFLSSVHQEPLRSTLFPLGSLLKQQVRRLAKEYGLDGVATKRDSVGICFIGKRRFKNFIEEYLTSKQGVFVDCDNGQIVGEHNGVHQWTIGQRCGLNPHSYYVAARDAKTQRIFATRSHDHPALFSRRVIVEKPHWICHSPIYSDTEAFNCIFKFQHTEWTIPCQLHKLPNGLTEVWLAIDTRAITPGQQAVFYHGLECLGSAKIVWADALDKCGLSFNYNHTQTVSLDFPSRDIQNHEHEHHSYSLANSNMKCESPLVSL